MGIKCTAYNKQFAISAGAGSQKHLFKFESESPVRKAVSRHLRQAADRSWEKPKRHKKNRNKTINKKEY